MYSGMLLELIYVVFSQHKAVPLSPEVGLVRSPRLADLCRLYDSNLDDLNNRLGALQVTQQPSAISSTATSNSDTLRSADMLSTNTTSNMSALPAPVTTPEPSDGHEGRQSSASFADDDLVWDAGSAGIDCESDSDRDFTACSADDCGYCGKCSY